MNITSGNYRGWHVSMDLINGTSGQIAVTFELKVPESMDVFKKEVTDAQLRRIFALPKGNSADLGFFRADGTEGNPVGFQWCFMFDRLKGNPSQFEYLAFLFQGLDKVIDLIHKHQKVKEKANGRKTRRA